MKRGGISDWCWQYETVKVWRWNKIIAGLPLWQHDHAFIPPITAKPMQNRKIPNSCCRSPRQIVCSHGNGKSVQQKLFVFRSLSVARHRRYPSPVRVPQEIKGAALTWLCNAAGPRKCYSHLADRAPPTPHPPPPPTSPLFIFTFPRAPVRCTTWGKVIRFERGLLSEVGYVCETSCGIQRGSLKTQCIRTAEIHISQENKMRDRCMQALG